MHWGRWHRFITRASAQAARALLLCVAAFHAMAGGLPYQEDLPPLTAGLAAPTAVAVGPDERIYVAEPSAQRVQVYNRAGQRLTTLADLHEPTAVAVGPDGRLYVGEAGNGQVSVYGPDLALRGLLGAGAGEFVRPAAIAVAANGAVYVADGKAHRVRVYRSDLSFGFAFGSRGTAAGQFVTPTAMTVNALTGEILVADLADPSAGKPARVQIFDQSGKWLRVVNTRMRPLGLAVDQANRLYVADSYQNGVYVYDAQGTPLGVLDDIARPLRTPLGMAYAPGTSRLFVASLLTASVETYGIDARFARIQLSDASLNFGEVDSGALSAVQRLEIGNAGTAPLEIGAVALEGADAALFFLLADGCSNRTLAPDENCVLELVFSPNVSGMRNARLNIASNDLYTPTSEVALRGMGLYQARMGSSDGDGIADGWELAHGLNPWNGADAADDPDGDGFSNLEEYLANSDPHDAVSNPGRLALSASEQSVSEGDGSTVFTVSRGGGSAGTVSVLCRGLDGGAVAGSDYDDPALWLEWADGDVSDKTCAVSILDDAETEGEETFRVVLDSPNGGAQLAETDAAEVRILDDDSDSAVDNDFNGDGRSDVLVRHRTTNAWLYYPLNGRTVLADAGASSLPADAAWATVGTGDYDGDGRADVLLRHGLTHAWQLNLMNGTRIRAQQQVLDLTTDPDWEPVGSGDFDGDGKADVLLRSASTRRWYFYPLDGARVGAGAGMPEMTVSADWQPAGVGDFNGDGADDVLLRHRRTGRWYYYALKGAQVVARAYLPVQAVSSWQLAGIGDFNGDGTDDVLLRNSLSRKWYYHPIGGRQTFRGRGFVALSGDRQWEFADSGDYDGDGKADVLLRHQTSGRWYYYPLDGVKVLSGGGFIDMTGDTNWRPAGQ